MDLQKIIILQIFSVWNTETLLWTSLSSKTKLYSGSAVTLEWQYKLSETEARRASEFSLTIWEREREPYANVWRALAVTRLPNNDTVNLDERFQVVGSSSLILHNATSTDTTRYRCTFFSSFASRQSYVSLNIIDPPFYVRLVGGKVASRGRVEINYQGVWGSICGTSWNLREGKVLCRALGYRGVWRPRCGNECGHDVGPTLLNNVSCTGDESTLSECNYQLSGEDPCKHGQRASVVCYDKPRSTTVTSNAPGNAVLIGEPVILNCSSIAVARPVFYLYHKTKLIAKNIVGKFTIFVFGDDQVGTYRCVVSNIYGKDKSTIRLKLYERPAVQILTKDQTLNESDTVSLYCRGSGHPTPRITWTKIGDDSRTFPSGNNLVIVNARKSDEGEYHCTVSNGRPLFDATLSSYVKVIYYSAIIQGISNNLTVPAADRRNITIRCNATGNPKPSFTWRKIGNSRAILSRERSLTLLDVSVCDGGGYACIADNGIGKAATEVVHLDVIYKPQSTALESSTGASTVHWYDSVTLTCRTSSNPLPSAFLFYHNNRVVYTTSSGRYQISYIGPSGGGTYKCTPINELGAGQSAYFNLTVKGTCGKKGTVRFPRTRVVGGAAAVPGEWPWQAQISYWGHHWCGGAIITPVWVVTSAHVLRRDLNPARYNVTVGEFIVGINERREQVIPVEKIIGHYKFDSQRDDYDIAMIKLKHRIKFNDFVKPICLPEFSFPNGSKCTITGWGSLVQGGKYSKILQKADVPIISHTTCKKAYGTDLTRRMLCAGGEKTDACHGDSGGPLACQRSKRWYIAGVTSWGRGCAKPGYYGVYADVLDLKEWISQTIRDY